MHAAFHHLLYGKAGGPAWYLSSTGNVGNTGSVGNTGNVGNAGNVGNTGSVGNTGNVGNAGNVDQFYHRFYCTNLLHGPLLLFRTTSDEKLGEQSYVLSS